MATGRVTLVREDIRNYNAIRPCFDDIDVVFHQAAIRITLCAQEPRECLEVLLDGTFNVLQACVDAGVRKVVAASSASVYGMADVFPTPETHHTYNNRTWYGAAKAANEGMLRSFSEMYDLDYVVLRYFNVYGPRMDVYGKYTEVLIRWLDCLDHGDRPKIYGDGSQTMDFVFSTDVARANLLAMRADVTDAVFNVGSGTETSLRQLLLALLEVTGHKSVEPEFLPERNVNPVPRRLAATSKAAEVLKFRTSVSPDQGLRQLVQWRRQVLECGRLEDYEGQSTLPRETR
jgi:UDP-glucose 4-epimerase